MPARLAALLGLAQSPGSAGCSVGPGMLLARWRALRGARVTPAATTVVQSQGQEGDEAEHPARDYYRRARDVSSHSVARSIASCSQLYRNQGLPTCCSRNVPVGNPLSVHAVAASAPSATWWTDVPSETPNNISFITSFGPSPRACICWYRCEPQWTAEAQYPASKPCPSYVDFCPLSSRAWPWICCHMFVSTNNILTLARPRDSTLRPRTYEMGLDLQPLDSWEF